MSDNYAFFLSGMPGEVCKSWLQALAGGVQTMKLAGALPATQPLNVEDSFKLDIPDGTNPSVCVHDGRLLIAVRANGQYLIGELVGRKIVGATSMAGLAWQPHHREFNPIRLYSLAGRFGAAVCFADYSNQGTPHAQVGLLDIDLARGGANGYRLTILPSTRYEKNWMPCVDGEKLRLVYSAHPTAVLDAPYTVTDNLPLDGVLRGSSQLVPHRLGWLAVVHQTHMTPSGPIYLHRFVYFDKEITTTGVGRPWHLQTPGVEIVAGLALWEGKYVISYGTNDCHPSRAAWIAKVSVETVDEMLKEG